MALSLCGKRILRRNVSLVTSRLSGGYVVLIPEIGEDLPAKSALIQNDGLPEFNSVTIENCTAAIATQTLQFEDGVRKIDKSIQDGQVRDIFKDVFDPLEDVSTSLELTWGLSKTLYLCNSSLMPTKTYLAIHDRARRARMSKYCSSNIFGIAKAELSQKSTQRTAEQNRILKKFVLEGKLNGLELDEVKKVELKNTLNKLTSEKNYFKQKIESQPKKFSHVIEDETKIQEFPENVLKLIALDSNNIHKGPWTITLQPNIYLLAMQFVPDREVRWNMWQASVSQGSGYMNRELATSTHLETIRDIRDKIAKLLGYPTYADMSMETKMAGSIDNVINMLQNLLEHAKPAQDQELESLLLFAQERGFKDDSLQLWDVPYWRKKQENHLFDVNEDEIKEYFPFPKVMEGMFQLCEKLFNIIIKQRTNASTWHKDVKFYDIFEPHCSAPIAGFYLDPYARPEEKLRNLNNNGWMVGIQNKSRICDTFPLASLIFNFDLPTSDKASCLTFKEVNSLFHKFGHALQHLLAQTNYSEVSGLSNVEWDMVEVCGHVLASWLYNKDVIESISSHCESENKLPIEKFKSLLALRKHMAGMDLSKELYLSTLDIELYSSKDYWLDIVKKLWPTFRSFPLNKLDSHPCSFTQIVTEEWAAGFYSHLWSRMIAADVYSAFYEIQEDEKQVIDVAKRFRNTFLAMGGSSHPSKIFREFRGRDPTPQALLISLGLKK